MVVAGLTRRRPAPCSHRQGSSGAFGSSGKWRNDAGGCREGDSPVSPTPRPGLPSTPRDARPPTIARTGAAASAACPAPLPPPEGPAAGPCCCRATRPAACARRGRGGSGPLFGGRRGPRGGQRGGEAAAPRVGEGVGWTGAAGLRATPVGADGDQGCVRLHANWRPDAVPPALQPHPEPWARQPTPRPQAPPQYTL
jgi:hypothetical protein